MKPISARRLNDMFRRSLGKDPLAPGRVVLSERILELPPLTRGQIVRKVQTQQMAADDQTRSRGKIGHVGQLFRWMIIIEVGGARILHIYREGKRVSDPLQDYVQTTAGQGFVSATLRRLVLYWPRNDGWVAFRSVSSQASRAVRDENGKFRYFPSARAAANHMEQFEHD